MVYYGRWQEAVGDVTVKRLKYGAFIDPYAELSEAELADYLDRYLPRSRYREDVMGFTEYRYQQGHQQGLQEGLQQGLLEAIEMGLDLKFGPEGLALMAQIRPIQDLNRLQSIRDAIRQLDSLDALRKRCEPDIH